MTRLSRRGLLQSSSALVLGGAAMDAHCQPASLTAHGDRGQVVRLDHNESPFGPSPRALAALRALGDRAWQYSYDTLPLLRGEIAAHLGVAPENVFVGEGSGEILKLVALLHGAPGNAIVASRPSFPMLPDYAARRGAHVEWVPLDAAQGHDLAALARTLDGTTRVAYLCNPNNPTGTLADPRELRAWIAEATRRALVVVDEAYIDFAADPASASVVDLAAGTRNLLVTRSFSKLHGLAGLRIGYGVADAALIRQLESLRFSIPNQAGVACARASLGDTAFVDRIREQVTAAARDCARLFHSLALRAIPTQANFVAFDTTRPAADLVGFARARSVRIAAIGDPLPNWVRVTLGRPQDMRAFAEALRAWRVHG